MDDKIAKLERQLARAEAEHSRIFAELVEARGAKMSTLAQQIVAAGEKRRTGGSAPLPPKGSTARAIVDAAAKARGEK